MFSTVINNINDLENDEKELERINNMLISSQGDTGYILSSLRECKEKYENFIGEAKGDFWDIVDSIEKGCLPFVTNFLGTKVDLKVVRVKKDEPEDGIYPNCWKMLSYNTSPDDDYYLIWSEKSYNKNAEKFLKNDALSWDKAQSLLNRSYELMCLKEKAEKLLSHLREMIKVISSTQGGNAISPASVTPVVEIDLPSLESSGTMIMSPTPQAATSSPSDRFFQSTFPETFSSTKDTFPSCLSLAYQRMASLNFSFSCPSVETLR